MSESGMPENPSAFGGEAGEFRQTPAEIESIIRSDKVSGLSFKFSTIQRLFAIKSLSHAIIFGSSIRDELYGFIRSGSPGEAFVGGTPINRYGLFRRHYWGRTKTFNKLSNFLNYYGPSYFRHDPIIFGCRIGENLPRDLRQVSWETIKKIVSQAYFDSRRIKESALEEVGEYLEYLRSFPITGNVIINSTSGMSYVIAVLVWLWANSSTNHKLVILLEGGERVKTTYSSKFIVTERQYISPSNLISAISKSFGMPIQDVSNSFSVWKATASGKFSEIKNSTLTGTAAGDFVAAIRGVQAEGGYQNSIPIPPQRLAPLIVRQVDGVIEVDRVAVQDVNKDHVKGAARAFKGAVGDCRQYLGAANRFPSMASKLVRIEGILERIIECGADEASVIEVGIEVDALVCQVDVHKADIGEDGLGEVISLAAASNAFLRQFHGWSEFKSDAVQSDAPASSAPGASILRAFSGASGVVSAQSVEQINIILNDEGVRDNLLKNMGISRSAENITSEAAKTVIDHIKAEGGSVAVDVKRALKGKLSEKIVSVISTNAGHFVQFSQIKEAAWLSVFLEYLKRLGLMP